MAKAPTSGNSANCRCIALDVVGHLKHCEYTVKSTDSFEGLMRHGGRTPLATSMNPSR